MSELTSELQRMADDAARMARPPAAAEIIRLGDLRRRRSRTRQALGGLSAAGVVGAGVALGLSAAGGVAGGVAGTAPTHATGTVGHATGTIRTAAFTLVRNANGTDTLTINAKVVLEPATLQSDLARDGIPAMVTAGSFCSSDPAPAGFSQVVSVPKIQHGRLVLVPDIQHGQLPPSGPKPRRPRPVQDQTMTINPAAMPAGTELSFGNFQVRNGAQTDFTLIDTSSYACTSTAPSWPPSSADEVILARPATITSTSSRA